MINFEQVQRYWRRVALLCSTLLIHLMIYLVAPDVGNSRAFQLVALGVVVACGAVFLITWGLDRTRVAWWRTQLKRWQSIYLILLYGAMFALSWLARPEWFYAHLLLTIATIGFIGYWTLFAPSDTPQHAKHILAIGGVIAAIVSLCLIFALRLYSLSYIPFVNITDEPWVMSYALSFLRYGNFNDSVLFTAAKPLNLYFGLIGHWFGIVGIGLYQGRLLALLFIVAQVGLVGNAAARFWGRDAGIFAALLMSLSAVILIGARIRHDAALGLSIALALWCYSHAYRNWSAWGWHFLAGLVLGFGAFAHYHASGFGVALLIGLYVPVWWQRWRKEQQILPERALILFGLGGLLGFLAVLIFQILPAQEQNSLMLTARSSQTLVGYWNALWSHLGEIVKHSHWEALLIGCALIAAFWRGDVVAVRLALSAIAMQMILSVMASSIFTFDYYSVPIMPLYIMLIAHMVLLISKSIPRATTTIKLLPAILIIIPLLTVVLSASWQQFRVGNPVIRPAPNTVNWLQENAAPEARLVGEHYYYFWLYDYDFVSPSAPFIVEADRIPKDDAALFAVWDAVDVDYFIHDPTQPTSAPMDNLVNSGYMTSRGYDIVAEVGQVTIYGR